MAVKIKLMRMGKMRAPYYRVVVADSRTRRDGRAIETIGKYHPKEDPSFIEIDSDRAQHWLGVGAQPTEAVAAILRVTGDWQRFKGEPAPEPMKTAAPRADRKAVFEAAAREGIAEAEGSAEGAATTPRKRAKKAAEEPAPAAADGAQRPAAPVTTESAPTESAPTEPVTGESAAATESAPTAEATAPPASDTPEA